MSGLPSIRYDRPARYVRDTAWGREWRRRWLRYVGSVHQHWETYQLVAFYSDERDPTDRLALQAELEARATGAAEVIAACRKAMRQQNALITEANRCRFSIQRGA